MIATLYWRYMYSAKLTVTVVKKKKKKKKDEERRFLCKLLKEAIDLDLRDRV